MTRELLLVFFGIGALAWCVSSLLFIRITFKRIEREIVKEGSTPPLWDRGVGVRIAPYAMAIVFKKIPERSIVDVASIKRHTTKLDWYLAAIFLVSFAYTLLTSFVFYFLYAP